MRVSAGCHEAGSVEEGRFPISLSDLGGETSSRIEIASTYRWTSQLNTACNAHVIPVKGGELQETSSWRNAHLSL